MTRRKGKNTKPQPTGDIADGNAEAEQTRADPVEETAAVDVPDPPVEPAAAEPSESVATTSVTLGTQDLYVLALERIDELEVENERLNAQLLQAEAAAADEQLSIRERNRRCPSCFPTLGGMGKRKHQSQVSGRQVRRTYKCNKCPADWTVIEDVAEDDNGTVRRTSRIAEVRQSL